MDFQFMVKNTCKKHGYQFQLFDRVCNLFQSRLSTRFLSSNLKRNMVENVKKIHFFYSKSLKYIIYGH